MWRIGYALTACFVIALAALAALWAVALVLLHHPALPRSHVISVHDSVGVAQLVFASVAGAGALVALVVAYRRQRVSEASSAHDRARVFNERFTAIAAQLGDDQPAVRLAGVHAMAGLADDWTENRQTCIDVLCAYLRLPYDPDPGDDAEPAERAAYRANREVRHTIIRLISAHLREGTAVSWQRLHLDFTGAVFDGGDFEFTKFSGGVVSFDGAVFSGGNVRFNLAVFSGGLVIFDNAKFSGGLVSFDGARFSSAQVSFRGTQFSGRSLCFPPLDQRGEQLSSSPLHAGHDRLVHVPEPLEDDLDRLARTEQQRRVRVAQAVDRMSNAERAAMLGQTIPAYQRGLAELEDRPGAAAFRRSRAR